MNLSDYFGVTVIVGGCTTILGWWLKSRLDSSIKHEYDRILEEFKSNLKRSDVLLSERLAAFKIISVQLLALRRYCYARRAELVCESEFESRTDSLNEDENIGFLNHHDRLSRTLDSIELLISPNSRKHFEALFSALIICCNSELWLPVKDQDAALISSVPELYESVAKNVDDVLTALYTDLGFPQNTNSHSSGQAKQA